MRVFIFLSVLAIVCVSYSYGQEVKEDDPGEEKEDKEVSEESTVAEESLQQEELFTVGTDLSKLNISHNLLENPYEEIKAPEETKLGIIVVPDLPEENIELELQSQNIFETSDSLPTIYSVDKGSKEILTENENMTTTVENIEGNEAKGGFEWVEENSYNELEENEFKDILKTSTELPTTVDPVREPTHKGPTIGNFELGHTIVKRANCTSCVTPPRLDIETINKVFTDNQENKYNIFLSHKPSPKKFERRTFKNWNFLNFGKEKPESVVKITKEVPFPVPYQVEKKVPVPVEVEVDNPIPVEVPKPYPVTYEKYTFIPIRELIHVPYPVYRKLPYAIHIPVNKPIPVHIPRPYPVYIEKQVPYPVEKQIPVPVNIPINRPIPIYFPIFKNIYRPIEKKVYYPFHVPEEIPVPVQVEKPFPVYVDKTVQHPMERFSHQHYAPVNKDINPNNYEFQQGFVAQHFKDLKTDELSVQNHPELTVNDAGFIPSSRRTLNRYYDDYYRKKNDNEPQESKNEEQLQQRVTILHPVNNSSATHESNTNKVNQEVGMKIETV